MKIQSLIRASVTLFMVALAAVLAPALVGAAGAAAAAVAGAAVLQFAAA